MLRILVTALSLHGAVTYLVTFTGGQAPHGVLLFLERVTLCGVILALVEVVKGTSARLLSLRVLSNGLFEDVEVRPSTQPGRYQS